MPMLEDFTVFFNPNEFGSNANFEGIGTLCGIFERSYERTSGGVGMANFSPAFILDNASVPASVMGLLVTIDGKNYEVVDKEPNVNEGLTVLILELA
jgi:hypothetical protein